MAVLKKFGLLALCMMALTVHPMMAIPTQWEATVVHVKDGDSLIVEHNNTQKELRLVGIDTPEYNQPWGKKATRYVERMCLGKRVTVQITGKDRYQRWLAIVYINGVMLNEQLVEQGYAWVYPRKRKITPQLKAKLRQAQHTKRGLWKHKAPVAPWKYRQKRKRFQKKRNR